MRIVAGRFRGRAIAGPRGPGLRPTSDRLRETLFNVLAHRFADPVNEARVLDLFAGTGALGLEALSRGARFCLFVDDGIEARGLLRANVEALGVAGASKIWKRDATKLGPLTGLEPFALALLDPPYARGLAAPALVAARDGGWLAPGALAVVEEAADAPFAWPDGFSEEEARDVGDSRMRIGRFTG